LAGAAADRASAAQRRIPTLAPANTVIDGPSADILSLGAMAVARDGTGGVVYLKNVNGVAHVFVSRLLGGAFRAPQQVDIGLPAPSAQPVIAASNPGQLLVAFINDGGLYVVTAPNALTPPGGPVGLVAGAANPALSAAPSGKAYLAFTVVGSGGHDVRAAYYNQGQWNVESNPLDANANDDAGDGNARPAVTAAGDGVGNVAWGEGGHIYTRRVWGSLPSANVYQADVSSLGGLPEISADQPEISSGGDSSYAAVVFRERFGSAGSVQERVLMNREHAGRYDGIAQVDGQAPDGPQGADQGQVAATEYGRGFITSETDITHDILAAPMSANASPTISQRVNSQVIAAPPDAVPAVAGTISTMIAWQQQPGSAGPAEIRLRYAPDGASLLPEQVISSPTLGPTNADQGLAAGGDLAGDAAASWVQGSGASTAIVAAQLFQTPGSFVPAQSFRYANSANPILTWSPSSELWGAPLYTVRIDGLPVANTGATSIRSPVPITNGRHLWQVTAVNRVGLSTVAKAATVLVDTFKPRVSIRFTGSRVVGATLHVAVKTNDSPAPLPPSQASGIKSIQVKWGDGAKPFLKLRSARASHVFKRRRTYTLTVIVKDRAANRTVLTRKLKITLHGATGKGKGKGKSKGRLRHGGGAAFGPAPHRSQGSASLSRSGR
jgi:hypothetical protein